MNPLFKEVKTTVTGAEAMADWLGDTGRPVTPILAEFRAARCSTGNNGDKCPCNIEPNWWDKVKTMVAMYIRRELELKNEMNLRVSTEDSLNMCQNCGCCLRLKVWEPVTKLRAHTDPKQFEHAPDFCWVKRELIP